MESAVVAGKLEEGIAKVVFIKVTVPSPGGIGVGVMAWGCGGIHTGRCRIRGRFTAASGAGMGMYSSAVTGNSEAGGRDEAALDGRKDSSEIKELLEASLEVKINIPAIKDAADEECGDLRTRLQCFLAFPFWLDRFFTVPGGREEPVPGIESGRRCTPEAVHEIVIGAEGRKGMKGTADKRSEDAVRLKPIHPQSEGRGSQAHGKKEEEKDEGTEDLRLVFGRPAHWRIERQEECHCLVRVEEA